MNNTPDLSNPKKVRHLRDPSYGEGKRFEDYDLSYLDAPKKLRRALRAQWKKSQLAHFVTAEPMSMSRADLAGRAEMFATALHSMGAKLRVVTARDPKPHLHAVVFPPRRWKHRVYKLALKRAGMRPCGDPKKAIQRVDGNPRLWRYMARHIQPLPIRSQYISSAH